MVIHLFQFRPFWTGSEDMLSLRFSSCQEEPFNPAPCTPDRSRRTGGNAAPDWSTASVQGITNVLNTDEGHMEQPETPRLSKPGLSPYDPLKPGLDHESFKAEVGLDHTGSEGGFMIGPPAGTQDALSADRGPAWVRF